MKRTDFVTYDELRAIERPLKSDFSRIGFGVAALLCVWLAAQNIIYLVVESVAPTLIDYVWFTTALNVVTLYLLSVPVFLLIIGRMRKRSIPKARLNFATWCVLIVICLSLSQIGALISNVIMSAFDTLVQGNSTNVVEGMVDSLPLPLLAAYTVIIAPIGEELIFRKALCDRLSRYGEACAIVISALIFAGFHGNLFQFVYAFLLGLVFAHVYLKTGKIRNTIFLHMVVNFFGGIVPTVLMKFIGKNFLTQLSSGNINFILDNLPKFSVLIIYELFVYGVMIAGVILLIIFRKRITFSQTEIFIPVSRKIPVMILNSGMITFAVFISIYMLFTLITNALL